MKWLGNNKILTLILSGLLIPALTGLVYFGVLKGKAEERLNCIDEKEKLKVEQQNLKDEIYSIKLDFLERMSTGHGG